MLDVKLTYIPVKQNRDPINRSAHIRLSNFSQDVRLNWKILFLNKY